MEGRSQMMTLVIPKLELDTLVPSFELPSVTGERINLWDFKQKKNLVIFMLHSMGCNECMKHINAVADEYDEFKDNDAEVLVILQEQPTGDMLKHARHLPVKVLVDENGKVARQFTEVDSQGRPLPSVFVVDRYNALNAGYIVENESQLPNNDELLASLSLMELECPECGV